MKITITTNDSGLKNGIVDALAEYLRMNASPEQMAEFHDQCANELTRLDRELRAEVRKLKAKKGKAK